MLTRVSAIIGSSSTTIIFTQVTFVRRELCDVASRNFPSWALNGKKIAGAAVDVGRAPDQKPSLFLARRDDTIATPHTAGLTPEAAEHQAFDTVNQVKELLAGRMPPGAANPDAATRLSRLGKS